jgi:nucleoside-diphosphate-sugar epimerase
MRLAITGGAGFLGLHLCEGLKERFEEILVLDIAPLDSKEYPPNVRYQAVDVRDKLSLASALKGMDLVIHGAAALPLWKKEDIYAINIDGTKNVLDAALENHISRVVYISSTAVYGVPKEHPLYEDAPTHGVGPYGESKIGAEELCSEYRKKGLCVPVVRPKTFIGTNRLGVFQILYDWVESGTRIPVIGSGKNRYQLLEVEDLVQAVALTLERAPDLVNQTFNVGAEKFGTVLEDVGALCRYAGTGSRVLPTPAGPTKFFLALFESLKLSPLYKWVYGTADRDSFVSIDKAKTVLGYQPRYSNADALIRSYQWYLDHKRELSGTGITHRVAWKQGILGIIKRMLK